MSSINKQNQIFETLVWKVVELFERAMGCYFAKEIKQDTIVCRVGEVMLTFRRQPLVTSYTKCEFEKAVRHLESLIKKNKKHQLSNLVEDAEEDPDYVRSWTGYFHNCLDHYYYINYNYALFEFLPMEWDNTTEEFMAKMIAKGTPEPEYEVFVEEEETPQLVEPKMEEVLVEDVVMKVEPEEESILPIISKVESLAVEERAVQEELLEVEFIDVGALEPIRQPDIPSEDYMKMLEQEAKIAADKEKVKAKPDKKKTKKMRLMPRDTNTCHEPYWDVGAVRRSVYVKEHLKPWTSALRGRTYCKEEKIVNGLDEMSIICLLYDQDCVDKNHDLAHKYHRRIVEKQGDKCLKYAEVMCPKEYTGDFRSDMCLMIESLAKSVIYAGNYRDGFLRLKERYIVEDKLTVPMHKLCLINFLNIPSTFGLTNRPSTMLERLRINHAAITSQKQRELVDFRNKYANSFDWRRVLAKHVELRLVCEYDAIQSLIENQLRMHFRIKKLSDEVTVSELIAKLPVRDNVVHTAPTPDTQSEDESSTENDSSDEGSSDDEEDFVDADVGGLGRRLRNKVQGFVNQMKNKAQDAYDGLLDRMADGVVAALKRAGVKAGQSIVMTFKSALAGCRDMLQQVVDFFKSATQKIWRGMFTMLKAIGVYDDVLDAVDRQKLLLMVLAILMVIYVDIPLVRGVCLIYILDAAKIYKVVTTAITELMAKWYGEGVDATQGGEPEHVETSFDMMTLMADWQFGVGAVICGILYSSCGIASTTTDRKSISQMVVTALRNIFFVSNGVVAVTRLAQAVPELITNILGLFQRKPKSANNDLKEAIRFATHVAAYSHEEAIAAIRLSKDIQDKILGMTRMWLKVILYLTTPECTQQPMSIQIMLRNATKDYPKLRNTIYRMRQQAGFRPTTFHLQLAGKPGIGKTTLFKKLVGDIGRKYFKDVHADLLTYTRDTGSDYWNGYAQQPITVCDDVWTQNDPKQFTEIITQVNNGPTPLNMAALEDKNVHYRSEFLLTSTNNPYPVVKDIFCMKAIWRRRHVLAEVVCDERVMSPSTGKLELSLFNNVPELKEYVVKDGRHWHLTADGAAHLPHLRFNIMVPSPADGGAQIQNEDTDIAKVFYDDKDELPNGLVRPLKNLTYGQLLKLTFARYDALRSEEKTLEGIARLPYNVMEAAICVDALVDEGITGSVIETYEAFTVPTVRYVPRETSSNVEEAFKQFHQMLDKMEKGTMPPSAPPKAKDKEGPLLYVDRATTSRVTAEMRKVQAKFEKEEPGFCAENPDFTQLFEDHSSEPDDDTSNDGGDEILITTSDPTPEEIEMMRRVRLATINSRVAAANSRSGYVFVPEALPGGSVSYRVNEWKIEVARRCQLNVPVGSFIGTYPTVPSRAIVTGPRGVQYRADFLKRIELDGDAWTLNVKSLSRIMGYGMIQRIAQGDHVTHPYEGLYGYTDIIRHLQEFAVLTRDEKKNLIDAGVAAYEDELVTAQFLKVGYRYARYTAVRVWDYISGIFRWMINNILSSCILLLLATYIVLFIVLLIKGLANAFAPTQTDTSRVMFKAKPKTPFTYATGTASQPNDIAKRIQDNSVLLRIGDSVFNGLGIDGSCILTAYHSVHVYVSAGVEFSLDYKAGNVPGEWWRVSVRPKDVFVIPNSDACVIYNKQIPMFRKIIHHFYTLDELSKKELADYITLHYRDRENQMHCDSERAYSVGPMTMNTKVMGEYESSRTLSYYGNPAIGTSGCVLSMFSNYSRYSIIGLQSCKNNSGMAYASVVTQDDLLNILRRIPGNIVCEDPAFIETSQITTRTVELFDQPTRFVGQVSEKKMLGIVGKTAFRKTILSGEFPSEREPAVLNAFDARVETGTHPMQKSMNKYGRHEMRPIPTRVLKRAVNDVTEFIRSKVKTPRVLSIEEAIQGVRGSTPYNLKTSPGIPFVFERRGNLPGKKPWIRRNEAGELVHLDEELISGVHEFEQKLKQGEIPSNQIYEFPKDELRSREKVLNARSISVQDMRLNILCRMYTLDLMAQLHQCANGEFPMYVGVNPESLAWTTMYKNFKKYEHRCSDADINNWDGHLTPQLMRAAMKVINNIYDDSDENKRLRTSLGMQIVCAFVQILDVVIHTMRGQKSGSGITAEMNTLVHLILFLVLFYIAMENTGFDNFACFRNHVVLAIYGDDILVAFSEALSITPGDIYRLYEYYGWPVSAADKVSDVGAWKHIDEVQFLKRRFKLDHEFGEALVYAAIEKSVINDLLHWMRVQDNPRAQLYVNINEAMEFAYAHGKTYYDQIRSRVNAVLRAHGMEYYSISYADMRSCIIRRYFE